MRPSEFNRLRRLGTAEDNVPTLEIQESDEGGVDVLFVPEARLRALRNEPDLQERLLNVTPETLTIWPLAMKHDAPEYFSSKYGQLKRFCLARPTAQPYKIPESADDVFAILESLPGGFEKNFEVGLGLQVEYRSICQEIASIPGIDTLIIHGSKGEEDHRIDAPMYILGVKHFNRLRRSIDAISSKHRRDARIDKKFLAYNELLAISDESAFPRKARHLQRDAITALTDQRNGPTALSTKDMRTVVRLVRQSAPELSEQEPATLLELKSDIERITLSALIAKFEQMLAKSLKEDRWQRFFSENPFILSMALSTPALVVGETPYFGGMRFDRSGARFGDFLLAAVSSGNLVVIEIKTPDTPLLDRRPYREGINGPAFDLGGAITQVLDQRLRLHENILRLKEDSNRPDIQAFAVRCVVVAGRTPDARQGRKNFELVRNVMAGVTVITFDELLERLREVHRVFAVPALPALPPIDLPF